MSELESDPKYENTTRATTLDLNKGNRMAIYGHVWAHHCQFDGEEDVSLLSMERWETFDMKAIVLQIFTSFQTSTMF